MQNNPSLDKTMVETNVNLMIDEVLNQQDPADNPYEAIDQEIQKALYGTNTPIEGIQIGAIDTLIEQLEDPLDELKEINEEAENIKAANEEANEDDEEDAAYLSSLSNGP